MRRMVRARPLVPLLLMSLVALFVASCAAQRKKEVTQVVKQYLDDELAQNYLHQHELIDAESAKALPLPTKVLTNPFNPKKMTDYKINKVTIEGATARAQVHATFELTWAGGTGVPEEYDLNIYLVHQPGEWKVDEIRTRKAAINQVLGTGQGDNWLLIQQQRKQFEGQ
jgi:hypothetical protein